MAQISLETNHTDSTKLSEWWKDVNSNFGKIQGTVNGNIDAANLKNGAVTADKLGTGAVTTAKLAAKSVTGAKIADYTIEQNQLAQGCVANNRIQNGAVDSRCLAADAVTGEKIAANAVGNSELAANAVTAAKLADNAVTTAKLADNAVTAAKLADEYAFSGNEADASDLETEPAKVSSGFSEVKDDSGLILPGGYTDGGIIDVKTDNGVAELFIGTKANEAPGIFARSWIYRGGTHDALSDWARLAYEDDVNKYDLTEVPRRIGTWIDGTPIWRIAVKYTITEQDITNGYIILEMPVKNNGNYFVLNQFIQQGSGSPSVVDDVPCEYRGQKEWGINSNLAQEGYRTLIYGWVDFAAKASDLEQIEPEPETELVYIPKFKNSDVLTGGDDNTHPAFIVNGEEIPGFYYSKYQNFECTTLKPFGGSVTDIYSAYGRDPMVSINFDNARSKCENKGTGWHLSTNAEWAAIALWSKKNGTMPYGNNDYGKDSRESTYTAIPANYDDEDRINRVKTGTGPLAWSHDNTRGGIWDMNGNIWEWQGGIRLVWGELQILENNNAADPDNSQDASSANWKAIKASDGTLVEPECSPSDSAAKLTGDTVKLDYVNNAWVWTTTVTSSLNESRGCQFGNVACADEISASVKVLLRSLALLPDEGSTVTDYESDYIWWNNCTSERSVFRGANWSSGALAGVFSLNGSVARTASSLGLGFRSAYIPESE